MPFLVLAGVLWGTGGLFGSLLADRTGLSALAVAGYRLAVGGLLLLIPLVLSGRPMPRTAAARWRIAAIAGLAALFQACYFTAVSLTSVSLATLVTIGSAPVIVLLVDRAGGWSMAATVGLAVLGTGLLVGLPGAGLEPGTALLGSAFAVAAGAGFATLTLLGARPVPGLEAVHTTGPAFLLGGAVLLAVAAVVGPGVAFRPEPVSLGLLVAFAVLPTAVAYACFFRGLAASTASVGAVTALLEPLTAAVLAAVVLGERLGLAGTVGAVLIGAAVLLAGRQERLVSRSRE